MTAAASQRPVGEIGDGFDPLNPHTMYDFFTRARAEQPVFYNPRLGFWVVTRYADIDEIETLTGGDTISANGALNLIKPPCPEALEIIIESGVKVDNSMVDEDPPDHGPKRAALRERLNPKIVRSYEPQVRELVTRKLDGIVRLGRADLVTDYVDEIPAWVIFQLMGVPDEDMEMVRGYAKGNGKFGFGVPTDEEQVRDASGIARYWAYAKQHVDARLDRPGDDIMSHYIQRLREVEGGRLFSVEHCYTIMLQLLFAGHETTTNSAGNAFRALLENRGQWDELCADPALVPSAVDECLRFATPVPHWRRTTTKNITIGGVTIPAGETVMIALASGNHDDNIFPHAEQLDIRRANARKHLAFGRGRHRCLGEHLALLELVVILEELTQRLPHIQLVPDQEWVYSPNVSHRGVEHVLVTWDPAANPVPADRP
ncbi:MAG TPA: cytochrome P450 [Pseudonocardia sp.]|jgi:hypothetical protein|nr:cytochrome P450 [Pseudonocardia sp.]